MNIACSEPISGKFVNLSRPPEPWQHDPVFELVTAGFGLELARRGGRGGALSSPQDPPEATGLDCASGNVCSNPKVAGRLQDFYDPETIGSESLTAGMGAVCPCSRRRLSVRRRGGHGPLGDGDGGRTSAQRASQAGRSPAGKSYRLDPGRTAARSVSSEPLRAPVDGHVTVGGIVGGSLLGSHGELIL